MRDLARVLEVAQGALGSVPVELHDLRDAQKIVAVRNPWPEHSGPDAFQPFKPCGHPFGYRNVPVHFYFSPLEPLAVFADDFPRRDLPEGHEYDAHLCPICLRRELSRGRAVLLNPAVVVEGIAANYAELIAATDARFGTPTPEAIEAAGDLHRDEVFASAE